MRSISKSESAPLSGSSSSESELMSFLVFFCFLDEGGFAAGVVFLLGLSPGAVLAGVVPML